MSISETGNYEYVSARVRSRRAYLYGDEEYRKFVRMGPGEISRYMEETTYAREVNEFGARFFPSNKNFLPLKLISSEMPVGINYKAGISAQLKSAVILAGLNAYGTTNIIEENKSRLRNDIII